MTIRPPAEQEKGAVRRLWEECFPEGGPPYVDWFFSEVYQSRWTLGLFDGGALLACLQMVPYALRLRGRAVEMDTLSGVSTDPAFRNRGHAKRLMAEALSDMARRGRGFTFLYPFSHEFYRRLGWETCSAALEYLLPAAELPPMPEGYCARCVPADADRFAPLYRRFMAGRNGYVLRGGAEWRKRTGENRSLSGFALGAFRAGEPCGYAFCEVDGEEVLLAEFVYDSAEAATAVLAALRPMGMVVNWKAPADDLLHLTPGRWMDKVRLQPHVMLRVVDLFRAVEQTAAARDGQLVLEVEDGYAPWNAGRFLLTAVEGRAALARTDRAPQFRCGIGALCRLLTGYCTASEAVGAGLARGEAAAVALLDGMYPKLNNFIFELY